MIYTRDLPADHSLEVLQAEHEHVRAHLSAVASEDDDPETSADDVVVKHETLPDGRTRITGTLNAEAQAPYLSDDYDAFESIDPELLKAAGL